MAAAQTEGSAQVGKAFGSIEKGLLIGVANAAQSLLTAQLASLGKGSSDLVGLIEPAPSLPSPVQGDGDQDPGRITLRGHPWIVPDFFGQKRELTMQMDLPSILVGVHEFARLAMCAGGRPGKFEGEFQSAALTAECVLRHESLDLSATLDAIGLQDSRKTIPARAAEVASVPEGIPAKGARWRVEKIEPAGEGHL